MGVRHALNPREVDLLERAAKQVGAPILVSRKDQDVADSLHRRGLVDRPGRWQCAITHLGLVEDLARWQQHHRNDLGGDAA